MSAIEPISVVVPTCGRPALLDRCLRALLAQRFDPAQYEIVVVDDGRSSATRCLVQRLAQSPQAPRLRYLRPPAGKRGPAAARNAGWRAARHDVLAFTDDDTIPAPDWLASLSAAMAPDVTAVWGRIEVPLPRQPTDWARNTSHLATAVFVTANCCVRRDALACIGGFDERFTRAWREDADLYFALLDDGGTVRHAPEALVVHPVRPARWGACLAQQRNNFFDPLLYKKYPTRYRQLIAPRPPLWQYAIVAALALALVFALAGEPQAALAAAAVWLLLTLAFALRRLRDTSHRPSHIVEMLLTSAAIPLLAVYWRVRGALHFGVWFV